jgi:hypothetical protein
MNKKTNKPIKLRKPEKKKMKKSNHEKNSIKQIRIFFKKFSSVRFGFDFISLK